jgi:hypothetical protein
MKTNLKKLHTYILLIACCIGLPFLECSAQQPTPVIFKPLLPPITDVYQFETAGLIAISNKHELQFWDAATKAYFGNFGVLPNNAYNCAIRLVEYFANSNTVAVVWEEMTTSENGKDTSYHDFLSVMDLNTVAYAKPIERNGMLAFLQYKYSSGIVLPAFKQPESIYQFYYSEKGNTFFTTDRNGLVNIYKKGGFEKSITTGIQQPKLFVTDSSNKYLLMADGLTASVKRVNIKSAKVTTITNLQPINTCLTKLGYPDVVFSAKYNKQYNGLILMDSINRMQLYNATDNYMDALPFPIPDVKLLSVNFNPWDSSFVGIGEQTSNCQRSLVSASLKTGIANMFSGGNSLQISSSTYGSSPSSIKLILSGISEQEIDLANLSEQTNTFLVTPTERNLLYTGKWEDGFVSVFDEGNNRFKLKVHESTKERTVFLFNQYIQCNANENLVGIEPKRKWFITCTRPQKQSFATKNFVTIYDSLGKALFKQPVTYCMQIMNGYPYGQQLFSKDGRFFMLKEYMGTFDGLDSCRLRVYRTTGFKLLFDNSFTELANGNISQRHTAFVTDSSGKLFYTAIVRSNNKFATYLYKQDLDSPMLVAEKHQLLAVPTLPDAAFYIKAFRLSKDEENISYTCSFSINDETSGQPIYSQGIRGLKLKNAQEQWGLNIGLFPEIQNVLMFESFIGIQMEDHIQFYKWTGKDFEYFLTLIPVYNEKTAEVSSLFVSFDSDNSNFKYYEKTGNDDCISFKFGNHSYKRNLFDISFNRPDLIIEKFPNHDVAYKDLFKKAIAKREERINNKLQGFNPALLPTVTIKNTGYAGNQFNINLIVKSKKPVSALKVTINGCETKKQISLPMKNGEAAYNLSEILANGENAIEVAAVTNDGIEGLPMRLIQNQNRTIKKPVLNVLIVSVGDYDASNLNLPFAVKDGKDMADLFRSKLNDTLFSKILVDTLFNNAATQNSMLQWIKEKQQANPNDYVIVFYSGHGLLNNNKELQLATAATGFDNATNTIDFKQVLAAMESIPSRQKLLLIDACHSGDLDTKAKLKTNTGKSNDDSTSSKGVTIKYKKKNANAFEAMQQIFSFSEKGSGTIVFSASGGMQVAYEGANYQNGYFTYALKEALLDNKAAEGQQGMLWLKQLVKYTTKRVIEISGGRQSPNLRISHPDINWRVK